MSGRTATWTGSLFTARSQRTDGLFAFGPRRVECALASSTRLVRSCAQHRRVRERRSFPEKVTDSTSAQPPY
eukprot:4014353-Prymnesium_polylepis.1